MISLQCNFTFLGFLQPYPLVGLLYTMVDSIPHQVHQWVSYLINDSSVNLGLLPVHHQVYLFPEFPGQVPDHPWKPVEYPFYRYHSYFHNRIVQVCGNSFKILQRFICICILFDAPVFLQPGFYNYQFADKVHKVVQPVDIHSYSFSGYVLSGRRTLIIIRVVIPGFFLSSNTAPGFHIDLLYYRIHNLRNAHYILFYLLTIIFTDKYHPDGVLKFLILNILNAWLRLDDFP